MIKKLDKLILKAFIGPFIATFFIAFFVLMMQTLWKYIDDLVGKGLDFITILQFLWYAGSGLLTLALPIAILISSIMTFGNLGENFQLVAVKSSGISLLRFMRPLVWVAVLLCGVTFLFGNYVIPYANLKFVALYNDIFYKKPAFDLKEGVFFTYIPNYAIKVGKKDADGKTIHDIVIFEQGNMPQDVAIVAEKGEMRTSKGKNYLEFHLMNGYRYQERGYPRDSSTEFIRIQFKEFNKLIDLSVLQKGNTPDSVFRNSYKMLSARQLNIRIDSMNRLQKKMNNQSFNNLSAYIHHATLADSVWKAAEKSSRRAVIPDSMAAEVNNRAIAIANQIKGSVQYNEYEFRSRNDEIRYSKIEWHRKFSLSLACLILFFIGAPLGSIIRKGGFGMPLVTAIILFLIFHLLYVFGEKLVKQQVLLPYMGMWLPIIVLFPVGIFFTYKALHDSQLFNKEYYARFFRRVYPILRRRKRLQSES
jgi:lipopolysaccharide export system permease protein